jgi:hypothetical protein
MTAAMRVRVGEAAGMTFPLHPHTLHHATAIILNFSDLLDRSQVA